MNKKIFIAGPYNHADSEIMANRLEEIRKYCVLQFKNGNIPISALLMGLSFASSGDLPTDTETWLNFCKEILSVCDELHVLMVDGWDKSSGVANEVKIAIELNIKVVYII
jgi:hypothetical protein